MEKKMTLEEAQLIIRSIDACTSKKCPDLDCRDCVKYMVEAAKTCRDAYTNSEYERLKLRDEMKNTHAVEDKTIQVRLWRNENVLMMQVMKFPEKLRGKGVFFNVENGVRLKSESFPEIFVDVMYLHRTGRDEDNFIASTAFHSIEQTIEVMDNYISVISKYNRSVTGTDCIVNRTESDGIECVTVG